MTTHRRHTGNEKFVFVTFTCYKWLNLFAVTNIYNFFDKSFDYLHQSGFKVVAYVIMPNHIHMILYVEERNNGLNKSIAEMKRFLAYEIVRRLKYGNNLKILALLKSSVAENEVLKGKNHNVFQLSFDAKWIDREDQLIGILNYMHHNPVSKKWSLVEDYLAYPYSSAAFYELDTPSLLPISDFRDFLE